MFTEDGLQEYQKYKQWISDENFMVSPDFVPSEDIPAEAVEYYKSLVSSIFPLIDFDDPDFEWPTGIGLNL